MFFGKNMIAVRVVELSTSRPYNAWIRRELFFNRFKPVIYTYMSYIKTEFDGKNMSFETVDLYFTSLKEFNESYMVVK